MIQAVVGLRFDTFSLSLLRIIWSWGIDSLSEHFLEVCIKLRRKVMLRIACPKRAGGL